jgi:hypothetical protein
VRDQTFYGGGVAAELGADLDAFCHDSYLNLERCKK